MKKIMPGLPGTLILSMFAALCVSCSSPPVREEKPQQPVKEVRTAPEPLDRGQQALAEAIASYENGNYRLAAQQLQKAQVLGLWKPEDRVRAYKYQAFMHCVAKRKRQCREAFKRALSVDPSFDLTPAEAGHPLWGPVFRDARRRAK